MESSNPIRGYREKERMTLAKFGELFGVNKSTVKRWEDDKIPAERAIEIERITGLPRFLLRPDLYPESRPAEQVK